MSKHHEVISVSDSWYETWKLFSSHFIKFIIVAAIPVLLLMLFGESIFGSFIFSAISLDNVKDLFSPTSGFVYFAIIAFIIMLIAELWGTITIIYTTIYSDQVKLRNVFLKSLEFFWMFVLFTLLSFVLLTVVMLASYLVITILATLLGFISINFLNKYFTDLQYVSSLSVFLLYLSIMFAPYFIVGEKSGAWTAIRKSFRLVKAHFWPLLIRILIMYSIIYAASFLLLFIPTIGETTAIIISIPIMTIYTYVLYNNLKPKLK